MLVKGFENYIVELLNKKYIQKEAYHRNRKMHLQFLLLCDSSNELGSKFHYFESTYNNYFKGFIFAISLASTYVEFCRN